MNLPDAESYLDSIEEPPSGVEYIRLRRKLFDRAEAADAILRAQQGTLEAVERIFEDRLKSPHFWIVATEIDFIMDKVRALKPKERSHG